MKTANPAPVAARRTAGSPAVEDASALPAIRGLHFWGAILVATVLTVVGALIDGLNSSDLGTTFDVAFVAGCILAALAVRRGSIFTAMVQPPLVIAIVSTIADKLIVDERLALVMIKVVSVFPTMVIGTAAAVVIGAIRLFAQPIRGYRRSSAMARTQHA